VISNYFTSIEVLSAEIEIQKGAVWHTESWHCNFESKESDQNHVLQPEGFLKDILCSTIHKRGVMKQTLL